MWPELNLKVCMYSFRQNHIEEAQLLADHQALLVMDAVRSLSYRQIDFVFFTLKSCTMKV